MTSASRRFTPRKFAPRKYTIRNTVMRRCFRGLCLLSGVGLIGGCGLFGDKDNTEPPAPLVDFKSEIELDSSWERNAGSGTGGRYLRLSPVLYGNHVIVADRKGRVRAYEANSGEEAWSTDTDSPISGGVGAADNLVMVGSSDGDVIALEAADGKLRWKTRVSSEVLSAPKAAGGLVIARTVDGKLLALDAETGELQWEYERAVPVLSLRGTSPPAVSDELVVAGFDSGRVTALSLADGSPIWETRVAVPQGRSELQRMVDIDAEPQLAGDSVYVVSFQGRAAAIDLESGKVKWGRDMSSHSGLTVHEDNVYVTDERGHVWALDRENSSSMWRQGALTARGVTAPLGFGRYVIVADAEGYVHWLSAEDGRFLGRIRVDSDGVIAAPVASNDTVFVYGRGGTLAALKVR